MLSKVFQFVYSILLFFDRKILNVFDLNLSE